MKRYVIIFAMTLLLAAFSAGNFAYARMGAAMGYGIKEEESETSLTQLPYENREETTINQVNQTELAEKSRSAYLVDYDTGTVLYEKDADQQLPIASMVKIMTLVIAFEEIDKGNLSFEQEITVSQRAAGMGGSQMFLDANNNYKLSDLIKGVVVCSANDAAVAIGETISGSVEEFIVRMNDTAKQLGMANTLFVNVTGLPQDGQHSCARDVSVMMRKLLQHEDYYRFSKIYLEDFKHPSGRITGLTNTNKLIRFYQGCDGGKTGFTNQAMFCLSATAKRNDMRLIATVIGAPDSKTRFAEISNMFNYGFAGFEVKKVVKAGENLEEVLKIKDGEKDSVRITPENDLCVFGKKGEKTAYEVCVQPLENLKAPIQRGVVVGTIELKTQDGRTVATANLIALEDVEKLDFWKSLKKTLRLFW